MAGRGLGRRQLGFDGQLAMDLPPRRRFSNIRAASSRCKRTPSSPGRIEDRMHTIRLAPRHVVLLVVSAVLVACGGDSLAPQVRLPDSITVSPAQLALDDGDSLALARVILDQDGLPIDTLPDGMEAGWSAA